MRRALSILLMVLFGAGPLSFALNLSDDITLPACCRRLGAHHCAMDSQQSQNAPGKATLKARSRCQQFPSHPNARTSSYPAASGSYQTAVETSGELKCILLPKSDVASIHLRTPVLRGPPASHLS